MSGVGQNGSDILKIISDGQMFILPRKIDYFKIVLTVNVEQNCCCFDTLNFTHVNATWIQVYITDTITRLTTQFNYTGNLPHVNECVRQMSVTVRYFKAWRCRAFKYIKLCVVYCNLIVLFVCLLRTGWKGEESSRRKKERGTGLS